MLTYYLEYLDMEKEMELYFFVLSIPLYEEN